MRIVALKIDPAELSLRKMTIMRYISLVSLLLLLFSCSNSEQKVTGRWKLEEIDYSEYFSEVPDDVRTFLEGQMKEEFERLKDKTFFEFSEENKMKLESPNYTGKQTFTNGVWTMNSKEDSLYFELSETEHYKIVSINDKEMVLKTDEMPKRTLRLSKVSQ
jgi:hypothetical protein